MRNINDDMSLTKLWTHPINGSNGFDGFVSALELADGDALPVPLHQSERIINVT